MWKPLVKRLQLGASGTPHDQYVRGSCVSTNMGYGNIDMHTERVLVWYKIYCRLAVWYKIYCRVAGLS